MEPSQLPVLAGSIATTIFVGSYLPMLVRAFRTRELSSYSRSSLVLANVGNLVQTAYVLTLPIGPIWGLHAFYLVSTMQMLVLHLRHVPGRRDPGRAPVEDRPRRGTAWSRTGRRELVPPPGGGGDLLVRGPPDCSTGRPSRCPGYGWRDVR